MRTSTACSRRRRKRSSSNLTIRVLLRAENLGAVFLSQHLSERQRGSEIRTSISNASCPLGGPCSRRGTCRSSAVTNKEKPDVSISSPLIRPISRTWPPLHEEAIRERTPVCRGFDGTLHQELTVDEAPPDFSEEPCNESRTCDFAKKWKGLASNVLCQIPWETICPGRCNALRGVCGGSAMHRIFSGSATNFS